jgi:acetyltransferase-like isoleucine patch superfamily enzyme|tara:strand:- start:8 stop:724 length:717 start_codon:yes stop_codon:yes gene_type:complete
MKEKLIRKISEKFGYNYSKKAVKSLNIHKTSKINFKPNSSINNAFIEEHVDVSLFEGNLESLSIGRCTYVSRDMMVHGLNGILNIGRYCSIAGRLALVGGNGFHQYNRLSTFPFSQRLPFSKSNAAKTLFSDNACFPINEICIGNDVWIGEDVFIAKNVKIGNGAVIAAKSVVTRDVPGYAIVAGNPAEIKKYRYSKEMIDMIEKIKWWEWPIEEIIKNIKIFKLTGDALNNKLKELL